MGEIWPKKKSAGRRSIIEGSVSTGRSYWWVVLVALVVAASLAASGWALRKRREASAKPAVPSLTEQLVQ